MATHVVGLTLGTEDDWPTAFEALLRRAALNIEHGGERHRFTTERMIFEPFSLRAPARCRLVIDRLAWWYTLPREWLKKVAMMDEVYLLNDPFTFQSMEKHTAYCAMMRLGLKVPETWMLPMKVGPDNERYADTAKRYNKLFDLGEIAEGIGYPMYMKPFDGGGWRGVTRVETPADLHQAYDGSGQLLMHLQAGLHDYETFARALSIGPQTRVMRFQPERPMHERYSVDHGYLEEPLLRETDSISKVINAFFRWEFNSSETIIKDGLVHPIDFANACPDVSLISLHVHFPWAMAALLKWSVYCAATGRRMAIDMNKRDYFAIADRDDLDDAAKLEAYRALALDYFSAGDFEAFCAEHLGHIDDVAAEYFTSNEFDDLLVRTVQATFQPHEHDHFVARYRELMAQWATEGAMSHTDSS
jgi:hypothetical protein